jgi:hypothetical protein
MDSDSELSSVISSDLESTCETLSKSEDLAPNTNPESFQAPVPSEAVQTFSNLSNSSEDPWERIAFQVFENNEKFFTLN